MPRHPPPPGWTRSAPPYVPDDAINCLHYLEGIPKMQAAAFLAAWQDVLCDLLRAGDHLHQPHTGRYERIPHRRTRVLVTSPNGPVVTGEPGFNPTYVPTRYPYKLRFVHHDSLLLDSWPNWPGGPQR